MQYPETKHFIACNHVTSDIKQYKNYNSKFLNIKMITKIKIWDENLL